MKESGSRDQTFAKAEEKSFIPVALFTRAIGLTASAMARAGKNFKMEISMKASGKTIQCMALAHLLESVEINMLEN